MKIDRFFAAVILSATFAVLSVSAQTQRPVAGSPAAAAPQTNVAVPEAKMAMVYSEAFLDPKTGIARFNTLLGTLNREFQPRQTEITTLQQKITTLTKEISDTQNVADPKTIQQKQDSLDQMKKDYQ